MLDSTTAAVLFRANRISLGLSQSRLARLSGVSRFKICTYELGDGHLSVEERRRLYGALQIEAHRLTGLAAQLDLRRSADPIDSANPNPACESDQQEQQ